MNKILPALFVFLALAPAARASEISTFNCIASNGVILKGEADAKGILKVASQWGFYKKDFTATLGDATKTGVLNVNLVAKDGSAYILSLDTAAAHKLEVSQVSGTILQLSPERGQQPAIVAYVRCDLRLR